MFIITVIATLLLSAIPFFMSHVAYSKSAEQRVPIHTQIKQTIKYWKQRPARFTIVIVLLLLLLLVIIISTILQLGSDNSTIHFYSIYQDNSLIVTIKNDLGISNIYYTTDGNDPNYSSNASKYDKPFAIKESCTIIATRKWLGIPLCENRESYTIEDYSIIDDTHKNPISIVTKGPLWPYYALSVDYVKGMTEEEIEKHFPWKHYGSVTTYGAPIDTPFVKYESTGFGQDSYPPYKNWEIYVREPTDIDLSVFIKAHQGI